MSFALSAAKRGAASISVCNQLESIPAEEDQATAAAAPLSQFDLLWHYDCVVSPLPRALGCPGADSPTDADGGPSQQAVGATPPLPDSPQYRPLSSLDNQQNDNQRGVLSRVFSTFDQNRDGRVSTQEISRIFHSLGIVPQTQYSIESLLARLDTKCGGHVNEQEFCLIFDFVCSTSTVGASSTSCSYPASADVDQDLLAAFHVFDKDGNGFISPSELQSVLCSLGFPQARQLDACVDMIARVDENGDGQVDFFEFKKLFDLENASLLPVSSF